MAKYVITFSKEGYIKYTSHLDMMRLFKRAFKKSGLHLEHSQGFNPMPKLSLAQPLSLGYEAKAEMAEFETKEKMDPDDACKLLNQQMPKGIEIHTCRYKKEGEKGLAASCRAADYIISIPVNKADSPRLAEDFLAQDYIPAMKKTKKRREPVEINIRPLIHSLKIESNGNKLIMSTNIDAGSKSNLSPELLLQAYLLFSDMDVGRETIEITREKLYL